MKSGQVKRLRKSNFTRDRLAKMPGFNPEMTEYENTKAMGLHRLYDAGKTKWTWTP